MLEALLRQPVIGLPSVRDDHGTWLNCLLYKGHKRICGGGRNSAQMDASYPLPIDLRSYRHQNLIPQVSTASSRFAAPYICFVYFHLAP